MADKKKLTGSFGTNRRRTKPSLDEIEKIAAGAESASSPVPPAPASAPKKAAPPVKKPRERATGNAPKAVPKRAKAAVPASQQADVPMKKTSVDLPLALYQDVKIHMIKKQMKFREYLTALIEADLKKHS